jgi:hypothetical protein
VLFILRLSNGSCVILLASDEQNARQSLKEIDNDEGESIVSVRALNRFGIHLSPTEDGSLEILNWDDSALDSILENEYPILQKAFQEANSWPFEQPGPDEPSILRLNAEFERSTEIMRQALRVERERFGSRADGAHS